MGAEVIYGILGLSRRVQDGEAMGVVYRIYNDFAMQFRKFDPDRFAPLACLPNHDPQAAADAGDGAGPLTLSNVVLLASGTA